jgi:hypothetical protein
VLNLNYIYNLNLNIFKYFFLIKNYLNVVILIKQFKDLLLLIHKQTFRDGYYYIRGLFIILFIDSCVTDDEPIWEPIE